MKRLLTVVLLIAAMTGSTRADSDARRTLDIYFLDMMGGASTLIVSPTGQSVLIDTGSLEPRHRDADRILIACRDAGIGQIDHLITTHFDLDHFGAILDVTRRIPVKKFYDSGMPGEQHQQSRSFKQLYPLYQQATKGVTTTMAAGDDLTLKGDSARSLPQTVLRCLAADKRVLGFDGDIDAPVEGFEMGRPDASDNARSIALLLEYGDFRCFLGGDITLNVEHHLVHPKNLVGPVDLYQITHHGLDQSNNPVLLKAVEPTVAVAMNGRRKGIQPRTFEALNALDSLQGLYQNHYNAQYGDEGNPPVEFIANAENPEGGNYIKASVDLEDDSFTIRIMPEGPARTYPIKPVARQAGRPGRGLARLRQSARTQLNDNILAYWLEHTIDTENGGFLGRVTNDNTPLPDAPKGLILNSRLVWTFSAAYRSQKDPRYLEAADRAFDYLCRYFLDDRYGGAYWMLDSKGRPTDDSKELYGQAFVIYALAEYHLATGKAEPLEKAKDLFRIIEDKCHDDENEGYFETFSRDWTPADSARLAFGAGNGASQKTMNTHLHVLEAWTNLYRAWKDETLRNRLGELIEVFRDHIINSQIHHFDLFFDARWNSLKPIVSFGHDIEGSWLLSEAAEVLGDEHLIEQIKPICIRMAEACLEEALDDDGGLFYEAEHGEITVPAKHWWAQAETAVGFLNAYQLTGDRKFLRAARRNWRFILEHQVDEEHGEWFGVAPLGKKVDPKGWKVSEWKAPYHNGRACMELIRRLDSLQNAE